MPAARKPRAPKVDLGKLGARVVSIGGPFNTRTLISIPTAAAEKLFDGPLTGWAIGEAVAWTTRELASVAERDQALAEGGIAAAALSVARDLDNPYTSANARSLGARVLMDTLDRLRELAPAAQEADNLDKLRGTVIRLGDFRSA